ncbi:hypothetical protein [Siphonobacter sp. SORGH_AS_0500]|uniref:hypothetical protein n=1 Tax=Siphonobacter sp. SORGH_AS_0500 TaxID=1864824 RepID=UPI00285A8075|nr:hypothetical protein [Siphonobacter sp. SORGH_AS_0500]MDR6194157.1 hypothetical protein [Siphonobacter sp. SORGH_AS_0500]
MNSLLFHDKTQPGRSVVKALVIMFWFMSGITGLYTYSLGVCLTPDIQLNVAMVVISLYWVYSLQFTRKLALSFLVTGLLLLWVSDLLCQQNAALVRWVSITIFTVTSLSHLGIATGNANFWSLLRIQIFRGPLELLEWVMKKA